MVEVRVREDLEAGADGAALGVVSTVDEARDTGLDDGACAHGAGLDGDVEDGVGEAIITKAASGFAKNDDFSVGGRVAIANGAIAGASEDFAVVDDYCADRDFSGLGRGASFRESLLHDLDVGLHLPRENNMREDGKRINAEDTESGARRTQRRSETCCLTIGEGRNKLSACGNSWNDCFKWIF
jgi:hypothetical protein